MATPTPQVTARDAGAPGSIGRRNVRRRGITSLLAMLYLIVFAALALGFYAQSNMAVQVSNNERRMKEALASAETGLAWIRYELSRVTLPPMITDDQVFQEVQMDLEGQLTDSPNLDGGTVGGIDWLDDPTTPNYVEPPRFEIPAEKDKFIKYNANGPWFRIRIEKQGRDIVVTSVGKAANTLASTSGSRSAIQVRFKTTEWPNKVFQYGMASQGPIRIDVAKLMITGTNADVLSLAAGAGAVTIGNVNSTVTAPTGISGEVTVMQGSTLTLTGSNYSVDGYTTAAAIQSSGVNTIPAAERPEWPTVDASVFTKYATNVWLPLQTTYENIIIPPNSNPIFDGTMTVNGVVVVKQPNKVSFQGGVNMCCVIVTIDDPLIVNDYTLNYIKFSGTGVAKKPLSELPSGSQFDGLRDLSGTFLIAPGFDAQFTGSFATVAGSVSADRITVSGNTSGAFTGSLVTLTATAPLTITGSSSISIGNPVEEKHPGMRFTERFAAHKPSYREMSAKELSDRKM